MLIIYAPQLTARLKYIAKTLLQDLSGVQLRFTDSKDEFANAEGAKLNYSSGQVAADEFRIQPVELLFEKNIVPKEIPVQQHSRFVMLYPVPHSDLPFDIFAASFYLLSRYEEYLPHQKDEYGRFSHKESIAFKNNFLRKPIINIWLQYLQELLQAKFPQLLFAAKQFRLIATYDIDMAYSYLHKGIVRNAVGFARSAVGGSWSDMQNRFAVLTRNQKDPFDVYEWLDALHLKYKLQPYYFFLLAQQRSVYDKNVHPDLNAMQVLIQHHAEKYQVGIHPSWQSGDQPDLLKAEIRLLKTITQQPVVNSRQHYLRFELPGTYRQLAAQGIQHEFSMGYGTINGFRASVAGSFFWYNLQNETTTDLLLHPFCFMDANSFYEQKYSPAQAFDEIKYYQDEIKKVNGTMITVWHNHILGADAMFKGWKEVYELFLEEVVSGLAISL